MNISPLPAARRAGDILSRLWRLPVARKLLMAHIFLVAVGLGELLLALLRPCLMSSKLYSDECSTTTNWLYLLVLPIKGLVGGGINGALGGSHNSFAAKSQLGLTKRNPEKYRDVLGWAAASAEDVFDGILQVTKSTIAWLAVSVFVAVLVTAGAFLISDLSAAASEEYGQFFDETCGQPGTWWPGFCGFAWKFKGLQIVCLMNVHAFTAVLPMILRREMCTEVFADALKRRDVRWLQRCLLVHWAALVPTPLMVTSLVIGMRISVRMASATEMSIFTLFISMALAYILAVIAWAFDLDGAIMRICKRRWHCCASGHSARVHGDDDGNEILSAKDPESGQRLSSDKPPRKGRVFSSESSFKHKQVQLLATMLMLTIATPVASWLSVMAIWVARAFMLLLLLSTDETSSTMKQLESTDAAFGLLVDAGHMKNLIDSYLRAEEYKGPLKRTTATYFRMEETLTISYRWNTKEVRLRSGLRLNMNHWQLEEVSRAIKESQCLYVWIDRLALPQQVCKLQTTLLARMMSIYATSKLTLALRTCAGDGDRYHQRAWTLQEFCTAGNLKVVTQPPQLEGDVPEEVTAVAGDEEELFSSVREWHLSRTHTCRPYWLYGFALDEGNAEVVEAMGWFKKLAPRVVCLHDADKIRALYPMLYNTPCEDQAELAELVKAVAMYDRRGNLASSSFADSLGIDEEIMANLPQGGAMSSAFDVSNRGSHAKAAWT